MTFETFFRAAHPDIPLQGATATLELAAKGATIPFMARYRKEQTGNLDEVAIGRVLDSKERWDRVIQRQGFIVGEIERQKKLTPELEEKIRSTYDPDVLEDMYLPFRVKRKSKATVAREGGLQPLADWIWNTGHGTEEAQPGQTLELWAFTFRNEEKGFKDTESVIQGAQDILTEQLAETLELRQLVRSAIFEKAVVRTKKADGAKANSKYERYFDYHEPIAALLKGETSHRYLAARRGWMEKELTFGIEAPPTDAEFEDRLVKAFEAVALTVPEAPGAAVLTKASRLALKGHVLPAIENEAHRELKKIADSAAISVFAENLRKLLLASPYGSKAVLGVDPGLRTGCKLAVVDDSGKYIDSTVIHLQGEGGKEKAKQLLGEILSKTPIKAIAVGNGTAGRETETFLRDTVKELELTVPVVMVNESGASVYSASEAAREEFPELDLTVRGAISIARRLQDPLAELVKVDPKSIGVGQYQHDVAPGSLKKSLELVVDSCVNQVGVNLNTASYHLLSHVSGIGPSLAKAVVERRSTKGLFRARTELMDVPRFSTRSFEQSAGFLRIPGGDNPLDNTGVHPERYPVLEGLAKKLEKDVADLLGEGVALVKQATELREEVGAFTYDDIVKELEKPGRDPRDEFVPFAFRDDIHELKDLTVGMTCPGIVTNVTNFGAFVDIGVHQDGLVHVSQLSNRFVKDPQEVVHPGMRVEVRVLEVHLDKKQIALSMKKEAAPKTARPPKAERAAGEKRPRPQQRPRGPKPAIAPGAEGGAPAAAAGGERPRSERPRGDRPRPEGARTDRPRPEGSRPGPEGARSGPRPEGQRGDRPEGSRGDRPQGARSGPRPEFRRPEGSRRPEGQRPDGPRPDRGRGADRGADRGERRPDNRPPASARPTLPGEPERRAPESRAANPQDRAPLNNPFAVLAGLKKDLKR